MFSHLIAPMVIVFKENIWFFSIYFFCSGLIWISRLILVFICLYSEWFNFFFTWTRNAQFLCRDFVDGNITSVVRWKQGKNSKEAREEIEGKPSVHMPDGKKKYIYIYTCPFADSCNANLKVNCENICAPFHYLLIMSPTILSTTRAIPLISYWYGEWGVCIIYNS